MFSWDPDKRESNIKERGVDFAEAALLFENDVLEAADHRKDYGEQRWRALGQVGEDHYLVAYTWRGETRHIIMAWKVEPHGRRRYEAILAHRAEGDAGTW
jgi:uncharacterized protein